MHELQQPYVPAPAHMPVRALVRGEERQGHVLGWRGERVYLQWTLGPGMNHLAWVSAEDVERVAGPAPAGTQHSTGA